MSLSFCTDLFQFKINFKFQSRSLNFRERLSSFRLVSFESDKNWLKIFHFAEKSSGTIYKHTGIDTFKSLANIWVPYSGRHSQFLGPFQHPFLFSANSCAYVFKCLACEQPKHIMTLCVPLLKHREALALVYIMMCSSSPREGERESWAGDF